jgi:hypothetical protein
MKSTQIQNYQMLTRVVAFTADHVNSFPKTSAAAEILAGLRPIVDDLANQASAQVASEGAMREARNVRAAARESLAQRLTLSEHVARVMNSDVLQMPKRRRDHDLISTAQALVQSGSSLDKEFSRHGLSLAELGEAARAVEQANFEYSTAKAKRASAIQKFGIEEAKALAYLERLDVLARMTLADNPSALAAWAVARRVNRTASRKREVQPPSPDASVTPDPPAIQPAAA